MGAAEQLNTNFISVEEYFELDKKSDFRLEYYDGEVVAMAGSTLNHNEIISNMASALRNKFRPKGCRVFSESVKLEAVKHFYYPYPDIMLTCHKEDVNSNLIVKHPSLIIEVLSKSTAEKDRSAKLKIYQKIPSVLYYVLVEQYDRQVEVYNRFNKSNDWVYRLYENESDVIQFEAIDFSISLRDIYENIVFKGRELNVPDSEQFES